MPLETGEPIRAAGIIYLCDDRVLLLKRAGSGEMIGTWCFPGGKLEQGETPEEAARRESEEEVGYRPAGPLLQMDYTESPNVCFTTFLCRESRFVPVLNEEHDGYVWARMDDLPAPMHPGCKATLEEYRYRPVMDSAQKVDMNGYITIERNPISRAGIFPYVGGKNLPGSVEGKLYYVYRPATELADPEAMNSFKLIPLIDDHAMLGPAEKNLLPAESKGIHGTTGDEVEFQDGVLFAKLKIYSQTLSDMIKQGKRDLSLGYRCVFEKVSGFFDGQPYDYIQRKLRGNHLALVNEARCDVAVLDHNFAFDHFDLVLDKRELNTMADKENDTKEKPGDQAAKDSKVKDAAEAGESKADGENSGGTMKELHDLLKEHLPVFKKISSMIKDAGLGEEEGEEKTDPATDSATVKPSVEPGKGGPGITDEKEKEAMDSAIKTLTTQVQTLQKDGFKAIMREASERDALVSQLTPFVGAFDSAELTKAEVAAYGVEKLGISCQKGQEIAALTGYLHGREPSTIAFGMDSATGGKKDGKYAARRAKVSA